MEASLIFPIVILCIFALIYMCLLLYQKVYIQSLADNAAQRGAATWDNPEKNIELGRVKKAHLKEDGLYWQIKEKIGFDAVSKKERLKKYINERLNTYSVLKADSQVNVELIDYIIYKKLVVSIRSDYKIPISNLLKIFGISQYFTVQVESEAVINEPMEFIRNTDFLLDTGKEIIEKNPQLKGVSDEMNNYFQNIRKMIGKFFGDTVVQGK